MTKVRFSSDGRRLSFEAKGHADTVERGIRPEIICSAVSILCRTLSQTVGFADAEGKNEAKAEIAIAPGDCAVSVIPKPDFFAETLHAFFVAETGFSVLAARFPENVSLELFDEEVERHGRNVERYGAYRS